MKLTYLRCATLGDLYSHRAPSYPVPTQAPTATICWRLRVPDDSVTRAAILDVLAYLAQERAWEASDDVPTYSMNALISEMLTSFTESDCGVIMPIGSIFAYVTTDAPQGCLPCDGTVYAQIDYPLLAALLDSAYLSGADFVTPDLRGRAIIGVSDDHALNETGGAETHTLSTGEMPVHTHTQDAHLHTYTIPGGGTGAVLGFTAATNKTQPTQNTSSVVATNQNAGGGSAHNNMQPYLALKYAIVAEVV